MDPWKRWQEWRKLRQEFREDGVAGDKDPAWLEHRDGAGEMKVIQEELEG